MRRRNPSWFLILFPMLAGSALAAGIEPQLVATPRARALPVSATNRPFLAANRLQQPVDLAARGYLESELIVSGQANIYDWSGEAAQGGIAIRDADIPYATRALVRRPADPAKASGLVVVELLNATPGYDNSPVWSLSAEQFLRRGDVWVGVTVKPNAVAVLRKFDPVRYGSLTFAFRQPPACQPAASGSAGRDNLPDAENGLAWDIVAQLGALLRSSSKENPLWDMQPRKVVATGYSQMGGYLTTYSNVLHKVMRLGGGAPIYDGFLNGAGAQASVPVNQCAAPLPEADPRRAFLPRDVPVVTVMTESEFNRVPALRREDSDAREDYFRLYEIPGSSHLGSGFAAAYPDAGDLRIAGATASGAACAEPAGDFPAGLAFNAIWQQFADLLASGQSMANVPRIETFPDGNPRRDERGNASGGWRLPQLDLPLARYSGHSTPQDAGDVSGRCALYGSKQVFDAKQLKALYGNRAEYLRRFRAAVEQAVAERRLVKEDGDALKDPPVRVLPAF